MLQNEQLRLRRQLELGSRDVNAIEPWETIFSFSSAAADWFRAGTPEVKRLILKTTGSNPSLTDKILNVEAKKPFFRGTEITAFTHLRPYGESNPDYRLEKAMS